ncbi:hypothetical protein [Georgenia yuyongxinii]|uniref:Uncharacterized protein n=1 Tax=Georgenia yuyongxinii TaxID=2589797 RepID=A0A552WV01_9MICO|nr:hypothetical protein [Georgenia yuyongxinii]TRW46389.1 hypothetical protein FJ693_05535 [Georgenia yuyongxinii]
MHAGGRIRRDGRDGGCGAYGRQAALPALVYVEVGIVEPAATGVLTAVTGTLAGLMLLGVAGAVLADYVRARLTSDVAEDAPVEPESASVWASAGAPPRASVGGGAPWARGPART